MRGLDSRQTMHRAGQLWLAKLARIFIQMENFRMKMLQALMGFSILSSGLGTASAAMMPCDGQEIRDGQVPGQTRAEIEEQCGAPESSSEDNLYYRKDGVSYRLHFNANGELESITEQQSEAKHEDLLDRVFSPLDKAVSDVNRDLNKGESP